MRPETVSDSIFHQLPPFLFTDVRDVGMVAGAVVGISLGVLIVILIIWLVFRKKEKKKYEEEETPNEIRFINHHLSSDCFIFFTILQVLCVLACQSLLRVGLCGAVAFCLAAV